MTLISVCDEGLHDHALDVELLPQDHGLVVHHTDSDGGDTLIALLGFPM